MMHRVKPTPDRPNRDDKAVQGKKLLLGLLVALVLAVGLVFYFGLTGGSTHVALSKPGITFRTDPAPSASAATATAAGGAVVDGPITRTLVDRGARDELRRRILAGWAAQGDPEVTAAAKQGRFLPAPTGDGGGRMDPAYIQEVVRGDFFPMAKKCYEELLSRKDAGGRVELRFTIVADEKLGGIVEDVSVESDGGVAEEKMTTCLRESLSTLSFRPPAHGGLVTVVYPIELSPEDDHDR